MKPFLISGWLKGAIRRMKDGLDYETRFLLNIGKWLFRNDHISLDEIMEYEKMVKEQNGKNNKED